MIIDLRDYTTTTGKRDLLIDRCESLLFDEQIQLGAKLLGIFRDAENPDRFVWLRGMSNAVYFQIGLVTLLGLAAKNAILIVEYAIYKHQEGMSAAAAAIEAARLRFRPILMTSLAFILGVLPLAISHGAGAGARQAVGTGVMGGMLAAPFLAVFFVPLFYRLIADRKLSEARSTEAMFDEIKETHAAAHAKLLERARQDEAAGGDRHAH